MYNIWSNIGLKSLKNLTKTLKNLTITLKYLTKNFEKLDNFAEKNAEGVIITPKKGLYETLLLRFYNVNRLITQKCHSPK